MGQKEMTNVSMPSSAFQQKKSPAGDYQRNVSNSVFTSHRIRVPELHSHWALALQDRLNELTSLPVGWDGYVGLPVSFQCAHFVVSMLERLCQGDVPPPSLVPGSDGSLQVEWHRNMFDVELDVLDVQNVVATRVNRRSGEVEVLDIQNDFSTVAGWISELSDENQNVEQLVA